MTENKLTFKTVEQDAKSINLGNLKTVEFDLKLPIIGKNGSNISWNSSDERWLTNVGHVTRPAYGRGNRVVTLTATINKNQHTATRVFPVTVLQLGNDIKVQKVFPINLTEIVNQAFYLPSAVAVQTDDDRIISHLITWDAPTNQLFSQPGNYTIDGSLKDTKYTLKATISVKSSSDINDPQITKQVSSFPLQAVTLGVGTPFEIAQKHRLNFLLNVDDDQMLYNFRIAAGLTTQGAPEMIGWDAPNSLLRGHTTGHYLSALSKCYATTHNQKILQKISYMVSELDKVQTAFANNENFHDGFLSGYSEKQFDLLEEYKPYPEIWAPYYTLHKILAGLLDAYDFTDNQMALSIAEKIGTWTFNRLKVLPHDQLVKMWGMYIAGEFGGMNDSLAHLAQITGNQDFIECAKLFDNDKLMFPLLQNTDALNGMHANQHIPQVIGWVQIFTVTHEYKYYLAAKRFWDLVATHHTYSLGGTGNGEMFHAPDAIASELSKDTAESCATYNMLKLSTLLYEYDPKRQYTDFYGHATFNHILATTSDNDLGESTYFMPTDTGHHREFDDENSCCHGTGLENHFMYNSAIYFKDSNALYINEFIDATLNDKTHHVSITTNNDTDKIQVTIETTRLTEKQLIVQLPTWGKLTNVKFNDQRLATTSNQLTLPISSQNNTLTLIIKKKWSIIVAPDNHSIFSIQYGPYLMAALTDDPDYLKLPATVHDLQSTITTTEDGFIYNDVPFRPLFKTKKSNYQLYFKQS